MGTLPFAHLLLALPPLEPWQICLKKEATAGNGAEQTPVFPTLLPLSTASQKPFH